MEMKSHKTNNLDIQNPINEERLIVPGIITLTPTFPNIRCNAGKNLQFMY